MNKAQRRRYAWRAKRRAKRHIWPVQSGLEYGWHEEDPTWLPKVLGIRSKTPRPCSDPWCCGNPRKLGQRTMQERRHGWDEPFDRNAYSDLIDDYDISAIEEQHQSHMSQYGW